MTWRKRLRPIVAAIIAEHDYKNTIELRRALRDKFRKDLLLWPPPRWPYRVWRSEIRFQMRGCKRAYWAPRKPGSPGRRKPLDRNIDCAGQALMDYP